MKNTSTLTQLFEFMEQEYDRNFWEEVVDPAFTILQERLDKVMREI